MIFFYCLRVKNRHQINRDVVKNAVRSMYILINYSKASANMKKKRKLTRFSN